MMNIFKQWHLKNDGTSDQGSGTVDADIDAELAWDITTGSNSVKIGIVDFGMQTNHVDFAGRVSGDSGDNDSHGTGVAGVAAAQGNNNSNGVAGVAWNTSIINEDLGGGTYNESVAAVLSASNRGAQVINNSWGSFYYSITLRHAFADVYKLNRVAVAAMGNSAETPLPELSYPAGFGQGIIAVGATDNKDERWPFSSRGSWIDVVAPGVEIYTTKPINTYGPATGTSFAAPIVSGIAGLLLSYKPSLYNDDIEQIIRLSTDQVDGMNGQAFHEEYGTGRVNARKALDLLRSPNHFVHKSATGGSVYSSTGTYTMVFQSSGLAPGVYIVKRYEVRKSVSFGQTYQSPHVWVRGVGTTGTTAENPNNDFGMGWCDIISSGNSSATLRTFVYEVWDEAGNRIGYYPASPSNVNFNYTILGELAPLTATISGPTSLNTGQQGTFTANATGGTGSYTNYRWWERNDDGAILPKVTTTGDVSPEALPPATWFEVSSWEGQQTVNKTSSGYNFSLKVRVYDSSGDYDEDIHSVAVGGGLTKLAHAETIDIPDAFNLGPNFPNPFTANTTIKYDLPTESRVTLDIYDVAGRKIRTLVTGIQPARYHTIIWDGQSDTGQDVQPGVYLYRMQADALDASDSFTRIEKLVKTWE